MNTPKSQDTIYEQRCALAVGLARMTLAAGGSAGVEWKDDGEWPVIYIDTEGGQISFHVSDDDQWMLAGLPDYNKGWDGKYTGRTGSWCLKLSKDPVARKIEGFEELEAQARDALSPMSYRRWMIEARKLGADRDVADGAVMALLASYAKRWS